MSISEKIKFNVSLSKYTSYRVGGYAKMYFKPSSLEELVSVIKQLPLTEEIFWLGLGSNVLIRDGGLEGVVIHTNNVLNDIEIDNHTAEGIFVKIGAGVSCAKIAKFCVQHHLPNGIWFAGIPGTMGGALSMNAGAFGGETWRHVVKVEVINRYGIINTRFPKDYVISYRSVVNKFINNHENLTLCDMRNNKNQEWFVGATLFFPFVDSSRCLKEKLQQEIRYLLQKRKSTQPIGTLNCGSVFKNPSGYHAGQLIESVGLKGKKVGGAFVSYKHANFIINSGSATAKEIEQLINIIKNEVMKIYKIHLETEVKIIGNP